MLTPDNIKRDMVVINEEIVKAEQHIKQLGEYYKMLEYFSLHMFVDTPAEKEENPDCGTMAWLCQPCDKEFLADSGRTNTPKCPICNSNRMVTCMNRWYIDTEREGTETVTIPPEEGNEEKGKPIVCTSCGLSFFIKRPSPYFGGEQYNCPKCGRLN